MSESNHNQGQSASGVPPKQYPRNHKERPPDGTYIGFSWVARTEHNFNGKKVNIGANVCPEYYERSGWRVTGIHDIDENSTVFHLTHEIQIRDVTASTETSTVFTKVITEVEVSGSRCEHAPPRQADYATPWTELRPQRNTRRPTLSIGNVPNSPYPFGGGGLVPIPETPASNIKMSSPAPALAAPPAFAGALAAPATNVMGSNQVGNLLARNSNRNGPDHYNISTPLQERSNATLNSDDWEKVTSADRRAAAQTQGVFPNRIFEEQTGASSSSVNTLADGQNAVWNVLHDPDLISKLSRMTKPEFQSLPPGVQAMCLRIMEEQETAQMRAEAFGGGDEADDDIDPADQVAGASGTEQTHHGSPGWKSAAAGRQQQPQGPDRINNYDANFLRQFQKGFTPDGEQPPISIPNAAALNGNAHQQVIDGSHGKNVNYSLYNPGAESFAGNGLGVPYAHEDPNDPVVHNRIMNEQTQQHMLRLMNVMASAQQAGQAAKATAPKCELKNYAKKPSELAKQLDVYLALVYEYIAESCSPVLAHYLEEVTNDKFREIADMEERNWTRLNPFFELNDSMINSVPHGTVATIRSNITTKGDHAALAESVSWVTRYTKHCLGGVAKHYQHPWTKLLTYLIQVRLSYDVVVMDQSQIIKMIKAPRLTAKGLVSELISWDENLLALLQADAAEAMVAAREGAKYIKKKLLEFVFRNDIENFNHVTTAASKHKLKLRSATYQDYINFVEEVRTKCAPESGYCGVAGSSEEVERCAFHIVGRCTKDENCKFDLSHLGSSPLPPPPVVKQAADKSGSRIPNWYAPKFKAQQNQRKAERFTAAQADFNLDSIDFDQRALSKTYANQVDFRELAQDPKFTAAMGDHDPADPEPEFSDAGSEFNNEQSRTNKEENVIATRPDAAGATPVVSVKVSDVFSLLEDEENFLAGTDAYVSCVECNDKVHVGDAGDIVFYVNSSNQILAKKKVLECAQFLGSGFCFREHFNKEGCPFAHPAGKRGHFKDQMCNPKTCKLRKSCPKNHSGQPRLNPEVVVDGVKVCQALLNEAQQNAIADYQSILDANQYDGIVEVKASDYELIFDPAWLLDGGANGVVLDWRDPRVLERSDRPCTLATSDATSGVQVLGVAAMPFVYRRDGALTHRRSNPPGHNKWTRCSVVLVNKGKPDSTPYATAIIPANWVQHLCDVNAHHATFVRRDNDALQPEPTGSPMAHHGLTEVLMKWKRRLPFIHPTEVLSYSPKVFQDGPLPWQKGWQPPPLSKNVDSDLQLQLFQQLFQIGAQVAQVEQL